MATIVLGLLLLFAGAELLVRSSVLLSGRLGVPRLLIGLTIVAFGTSAPEVVASIVAAVQGLPGIAVGNIVGSNITNSLLVAGAAAVIAPITVTGSTLRRDGVVALVSAGALWLICATQALNAPTGVALLIGLAGYVAYSYRSERLVAESGARAGISESTDTGGEPRWLPSGWSGSLIAVLGCVAGIALLAFGGRMLVEAAVLLANDLGVSDTIIGLTVVAVGTSLPELATSVVAAFRRQSDIAIGNVVGSNIFNVLGIGGLTGLLVSGEIPSRLALIDFPIMLGVTALLVVVAATGRRIGRVEGAMLVTAFGMYLGIVGFTAAS